MRARIVFLDLSKFEKFLKNRRVVFLGLSKFEKFLKKLCAKNIITKKKKNKHCADNFRLNPDNRNGVKVNALFRRLLPRLTPLPPKSQPVKSKTSQIVVKIKTVSKIETKYQAFG